jgi:RHS repeat-associated protein
MLDNLNLTHMNGRVYDQNLGRFLSADPFITEPLNTQNYNRYSYVYNNPLAYVDPSGFDGLIKPLATTGENNWGPDYTDTTALNWTDLMSPGTVSATTLPTERERGDFGGSATGQNTGEIVGWLACPRPDLAPRPVTAVNNASTGIASSLVISAGQIAIPGYASSLEADEYFRNGQYGWGTAYSALSLAEMGLAVMTLGISNEAMIPYRVARYGTQAARGTSRQGGIISSTTNSAGGTVVTATGRVVGSDFAGAVNSGMLRGGPVNILSGVHGEASGLMRAERAFFEADWAAFGNLDGVNVLDVTRMAPGEISGLLKGPGTTIGAFCDSAACLAPFQ